MDDKYLSVDTGIVIDGKIYTVDDDFWFFVSVDINNGSIRLIADLQPYFDKGLCWIKKIVFLDGWFYLIRRNSHELISVNINGEIRVHILDKRTYGNDVFINAGAVVKNEILYIFPGSTDGSIICYNIRLCDVEKVVDISAVFGKEYEMFMHHEILTYYEVPNTGEVCFAVKETDALFFLSLDGFCLNICRCGNGASFYYVIPDGNSIMIRDLTGHVMWKYDSYHGFSSYETPGKYVLAFSNGKNICCLEESKGKIDIFDEDGDLIKELPLPDRSELVFKVRHYDERFAEVIEVAGKLCLLPFSSNGMVIIDYSLNSIDFISTIIPARWIIEKQIGRNRFFSIEKADCGLQDLIDAIDIPTRRKECRGAW